jgi:hypothetical protein
VPKDVTYVAVTELGGAVQSPLARPHETKGPGDVVSVARLTVAHDATTSVR